MHMDQVWKHHLRSERARQSLAADAGAWAPFGGTPLPDVLDEMASEEERRAVLVLVAAAEAALLLECDVIASQEQSPRADELRPLVQRARAAFQKGTRRGAAPDLGNVLNILESHGNAMVKAAISGFRSLVDNRHWLAHGRQSHWTVPSTVDAPGAWSSIRVLFDSLGFPMPSQPTGWV